MLKWLMKRWRTKPQPVPSPFLLFADFADTPEEEFGAGNFVWIRDGAVYAADGEMVVCEGAHQHVICQFYRDVLKGEPWDPTAIAGWVQPEPKRGMPAQPCIHCGARWFKGVYLHFRNGWRI